MAQRHEALLAVKAVEVFALEHGIVEYLCGADKVDAVVPHVFLPARLFPLEHERPRRR